MSFDPIAAIAPPNSALGQLLLRDRFFAAIDVLQDPAGSPEEKDQAATDAATALESINTELSETTLRAMIRRELYDHAMKKLKDPASTADEAEVARAEVARYFSHTDRQESELCH